jgi:hypothetical protein
MSAPLLAGAAFVDITPPAGLAMSGYVARTEPAKGMHDPLTARALVVDDTAILAVDVLGLDGATTRAIAKRCSLPEDNVVVTALHTHGGPQVRLGGDLAGVDRAYMTALETAAVEALDRAWTARRPAQLSFGIGRDPDIARNRRRADGPTDQSLPVLDIVGTDGSPIATLLAYACHPVVLAADNRLWTADYPAFVRDAVEATRPGTVALFLTGCTADANNGHSAHASISLAADAERTFAVAERIGTHIASEALAAKLAPVGSGAGVHSRTVELGFTRRSRAGSRSAACQMDLLGRAGSASKSRRSPDRLPCQCAALGQCRNCRPARRDLRRDGARHPAAYRQPGGHRRRFRRRQSRLHPARLRISLRRLRSRRGAQILRPAGDLHAGLGRGARRRGRGVRALAAREPSRLSHAMSDDFLREAREVYISSNRGTLEWMLDRPPLQGVFLNTKMNSITLADYSDADGWRGPRFLYGWIQGRGLEALTMHAAFFEREDPAFAAKLNAASRALYAGLKDLYDRYGGAFFTYDETSCR